MDYNEARGAGQATPGDTAPVLQVLVVEDNMVNRELLCTATVEFGHVAHEAMDGALAVERVAAGGIDLVLMDIEMPNMDGLEAMRRIRRLAPPLNATPIWVVSAHVFPTDAQAALDAGANGFLGKPLYIPKLLDVFQWACRALMVEHGCASSHARPLIA